MTRSDESVGARCQISAKADGGSDFSRASVQRIGPEVKCRTGLGHLVTGR